LQAAQASVKRLLAGALAGGQRRGARCREADADLSSCVFMGTMVQQGSG
jgi:hypothetical protein